MSTHQLLVFSRNITRAGSTWFWKNYLQNVSQSTKHVLAVSVIDLTLLQ